MPPLKVSHLLPLQVPIAFVYIFLSTITTTSYHPALGSTDLLFDRTQQVPQCSGDITLISTNLFVLLYAAFFMYL